MNNQVIRECERAHYLMQLSSYFSELTDLPGVSLAYTNLLKDTWYNQAYNIVLGKKSIDELLECSECYFSARKRDVCFYLTPASAPHNLGELLEEKGYAVFDEEAWMFLDIRSASFKLNENIVIKEVNLDLLDVFENVYRKTLPGPEVDRYIDCVFNGFLYRPPLVDIKYYLAYNDNNPVGMLSLLVIGKYAGLYAIATDEIYRGKGVCKSLIAKSISYCRDKGIDYFYLQTGNDGESRLIFEKIGFTTEFVRKGYAKQSFIDEMQHG